MPLTNYKCVISNSSPLMNLAIIGQLDLIKALFGRVLIPHEVWQELTVAGKGKPGSTELQQAEWIKRMQLGNKTLYPLLRKDLDDGEAAAIALAIEQHADLILLDETDARNMADLYSLPKTGVIGIVTRAKNHHLIQEVKPLFDALKTQANFWIQPLTRQENAFRTSSLPTSSALAKLSCLRLQTRENARLLRFLSKGPIMDFFQHQEQAKRRTNVLFVMSGIAAILVAITLSPALVFPLLYFSLRVVYELDFSGTVDGEPIFEAAKYVLTSKLALVFIFLIASMCILWLIHFASMRKRKQLAQGGSGLAERLGGTWINPKRSDFYEKRLLNVVEEMAIASGMPVPRVFVLSEEPGINAFTAGLTPDDTVIGGTQGCLTLLTRDELQGIIAHEFSHFLNGDARLNLEAIGLLQGIRSMYAFGRDVIKPAGEHPVMLLAALFLIIFGSIGAFCSRLIKVAISRQREFLADAAAVQFTRNPDGIVNALKKIGGLPKGSRLRHPLAEKASHLFFASGVKRWLASLTATHPPLEERIRRIEPEFDGTFPQLSVEQPQEQSIGEEQPEQQPASPQTEGQIVNLTEENAVSRVRTVTPEHLNSTRLYVKSLPSHVRHRLRDTAGAQAILYRLLLSGETHIRNSQLTHLQEQTTPDIYQTLLRVSPLLNPLEIVYRLPLVEMALPVLRTLTDQDYKLFRKNILVLIKADHKISLFEYALHRMMLKHLDPLYTRKKSLPKKPSKRKLRGEFVVLLSTLAYWGHDADEDALKAFVKGAESVKMQQPVAIMPRTACSWSQFGASLDRLAMTSPNIKKGILKACVTCIMADKRITANEVELLRVIADGLNCQMPPFITQKLAGLTRQKNS